MRTSILVLLTGLLLAVPTAALSQSFQTAPAGTIGVGFGPFSIVPASVATPVFAPGDELWVQSYLSSSATYISLTSPSGEKTPLLYLGPAQLARIFSFAQTDPPGVWELNVTTYSPKSSYLVNVTLAAPAAPLTPSFTGANLSLNTLNLGYSLPPTGAYDIEACTLGEGPSSVSTYSLPPSIGGELEVNLTGTGVSASAPGAQSQFNAWFELYAPRSYVEGGALVSQEDLVGQTGVVTLGGSPAPVLAGLSQELGHRLGRYELRSFARGPTGLTAFAGEYLLTGSGTWISLSDCGQLLAVSADTFALASNLDSANSTWPRSLYTMYEENGVEAFTISVVPVQEARVDVRALSDGARVSGASISASGTGITSWDSYASGVYLVGTSIPARASVSVDYEGVVTQTYSVELNGSFNTALLRVPVGILMVKTTSGGAPSGNVTVEVSLVGSAPATLRTDGQGNATLTLPAGNYNVTAASSGGRASVTAVVLSGSRLTESLEVGSQNPPTLLYALVAALGVGAVLNFVVWRTYLQRREIFGGTKSVRQGEVKGPRTR